MDRDNIKEITKEMYELAMKNHGRIPNNKKVEVFGIAIVCGYGLYGNEVYEENGKYFVRYDCGSSCD